jgi:catechol 2,3-dioxygenase
MQHQFKPVLSHLGISCFDIDQMIEFYSHVFDLKVTDKGVGFTFPFKLAFLSASPTQHHQLALAQNRPQGTASTVMQISFKVNSLDDLREARKRALLKGATKMRGLNHGNAISIYFMDVEENTVEVYLDTPWYISQPHGDPLDLDRPDHEIWSETEEIVKSDPTFMTVDEWSKKFDK